MCPNTVHGVSTVQEIEAAIEKLPREQFFALVDWLRAKHAEAWDRQIEEDAKSGQLDALYARVVAEDAGQPDRPLNEILDEGKLP